MLQLEERYGWIFAEKADRSKQGILAMNGEEVRQLVSTEITFILIMEVSMIFIP